MAEDRGVKPEDKDHGGHFRELAETGPVNPLTSIRGGIHCSATQDAYANEADKIMAKSFLHTLAEVALAIASRQVGR